MVNTNKVKHRLTCILLSAFLVGSAVVIPLHNVPKSNSTITFSGTNDGMYLAENGTVAVFVGGVLVGYIFSVVVDGIVISATGSSSAEWVASAISAVVGKASRSSVYLPSGGGGGGSW